MRSDLVFARPAIAGVRETALKNVSAEDYFDKPNTSLLTLSSLARHSDRSMRR